MTPLPDFYPHFDIIVRSKEGQTRTYRTVYYLRDTTTYPDDRLRTSTTRVYRAIRVENGEEIGPPVDLKDTWVHPDCVREGDIIQRIREDALEAEDKELVEQYIPNVEFHGDVFIGDDEPALDCTLALPTDGLSQDSTSEISKRRLVHYRLVHSPTDDKTIDCHQSFPVPVIFQTLSRVAKCMQRLPKSFVLPLTYLQHYD